MKGNFILGTGSGKLGDVVFRRSRGKQVVSAKVQPKNPKSEAQCRQRMAFATLTTAAARLRTIVDHSFEGVKYGQTSTNHFIKINMGMARAAALWDGTTERSENNDFAIKGSKALCLLPYRISTGSLTAPIVRLSDDNAVLFFDYADRLQRVNTAELYTAALASLGIEPGDQLSVVSVFSTGQQISTYDPTGAYNEERFVELARVVFKKASEIDWGAIPDDLDLGGVVDHDLQPQAPEQPFVVDIEKTIQGGGYWAFTENELTHTETVTFVLASPVGTPQAAAVIRSRYENGSWRRSNATLMGNAETDADAEMVWPSYANNSNASSSMWLNQAETGSSHSSSIPRFSWAESSPAATTESWGGRIETQQAHMNFTAEVYKGATLIVSKDFSRGNEGDGSIVFDSTFSAGQVSVGDEIAIRIIYNGRLVLEGTARVIEP